MELVLTIPLYTDHLYFPKQQSDEIIMVWKKLHFIKIKFVLKSNFTVSLENILCRVFLDETIKGDLLIGTNKTYFKLHRFTKNLQKK